MERPYAKYQLIPIDSRKQESSSNYEDGINYRRAE